MDDQRAAGVAAAGVAPPRTRWIVAAVALSAAVGVALRLTTFGEVFGAGGVRLVPDGDPYYHVRRALLILEHGGLVWRDPWLDYPAGADIPWPPLFDLSLAAVSWLAGLGHPTPETVSAAAAVLPVVLGLGAVALGAALAAVVFDAAAGLGTALLLAVSWPGVYYSLLGRADQHVLELVLFGAVALAFARGLRDERPRPGAVLLLGAGIALSFWNWLGSAVTLGVLGASCAVAGVVAAPGDVAWRRAASLFARACAVAAALLLGSLWLAGPAGALGAFTLGGLSAFQPALCALSALLAGSLLLARSRSRARRAAVLVGAPVAILAVALLAVPPLREPVVRGLTAAGTANTWYGSIGEFMPSIFSGLRPVGVEALNLVRAFGLVPLLAVAGVAEAWRRARRDAERREAIVFTLVVAVAFAAATVLMTRFMLYATLPLAILASLGVAAIHRRAAAWRPRAGAIAAAAAGLIAVAPSASALVEVGARGLISAELEQALRRLRPGAEREPRSAVLAPWELGHHVLALADRPVIASPFGTEGGATAMEDVTAFFVEADPGAAERLLLRRGVRYVLLRTPVEEMATLVGHGVRTAGMVQTARHVALERIPELVAFRLFFAAGATDSPARPPLDGFRLVDEVESDSDEPVRLFELVPGATIRVRGATPGRLLVARTDLTAPFGATGAWQTVRIVDARGEALLRIPYATGANGRLQAGPVVIGDGDRTARVALSERQVVEGESLAVALAAP